MRVGIGYDIHRLVKGRKLILGGVEISHTHGLDGHSDADVIIHAIMDALLGAAALGDIGKHFPNTDAKYKGISSVELLKHVVKLITDHRSLITNIDAMVIAEAPKLAPHIEKMRENIAKACGIDIGQISIKSTTNEGVGFIGRNEGMAAQAVCLLRLNGE
ncbi:MAG: 2-C-methyl-D-erythritol 2,4-cyclodiphosphate synthase [Deltaproteobacteria bacterium CG11_big_fil_rev_8_21_14_0_20_49_13]|nr:MAG: 2-C-methyl-D-erythritol 2,4-cyclodiphosphate synthase [Deltaproteobacteria bacterium CG11_big_fil_rev_8_21_14_0_20_49_13]